MKQHASQSHSDQRSAHLTFNCNNCGNKHEARREKCPAYGQQCHKCEKWNHFQKCCKSSQTQGYKKRYVNQVETVQASSSDEELYFVDGVSVASGTVDAVDSHLMHRSDIFSNVHINGKPVELKVNTGAKCNVMAADLFETT